MWFRKFLLMIAMVAATAGASLADEAKDPARLKSAQTRFDAAMRLAEDQYTKARLAALSQLVRELQDGIDTAMAAKNLGDAKLMDVARAKAQTEIDALKKAIQDRQIKGQRFGLTDLRVIAGPGVANKDGILEIGPTDIDAGGLLIIPVQASTVDLTASIRTVGRYQHAGLIFEVDPSTRNSRQELDRCLTVKLFCGGDGGSAENYRLMICRGQELLVKDTIIKTGEWAWLRGVIDGKNLRVYIDNKEYAKITIDDFRPGAIGIMVGGLASAEVREVSAIVPRKSD